MPINMPSSLRSESTVYSRLHGRRKYQVNNDNKTFWKLGHRRITEEGTVTYKKTPTSEIQQAIQIGIHHSIAKLQRNPSRDVLLSDFATVETVDFPRSGSKTTPAHNLSDFKFRTFAPIAFRSFREKFDLDIRDYLNSLCIMKLHELSNPGASGSIFYITEDDEFIIKTVQHKEADFLQKLLPEYYMNLLQHTRTLLPKFYGLYCYQSLGRNIRFVVMNNLLPSSIKMHQKYDLKGSSYKRKASERELAKSSPTLKDLDFKERHSSGILLEEEAYNSIMATIQRDCLVLESFHIMDYSLLLAVHNLDEAEKENSSNAKNSTAPVSPVSPTNEENGTNSSTQSRSLPSHKHSLHVKFRNLHSAPSLLTQKGRAEKNVTPLDGLHAYSSNGDRLILYIGIIDILQKYRTRKRMEHSLKSTITDSETVSVISPSRYARRFLATLGTCVFSKLPSDSQFLRNSAAHYQTYAKHSVSRNFREPSAGSLASGRFSAQFHRHNISSPSSTMSLRSLGPSQPHHAACSKNGRLKSSDILSYRSPFGENYSRFNSHNSTSLPYGLARFASQSDFFQSEGQLSWCAQSILSLNLDSDAAFDSEFTSSSDSENPIVSFVEDSPSVDATGPISSCFPNHRLVKDDTTVTLCEKESHDATELDSELLAVQKIVRRQGATSRKRETDVDLTDVNSSGVIRRGTVCASTDPPQKLMSQSSDFEAVCLEFPVSSNSVHSFMQAAENDFIDDPSMRDPKSQAVHR